MNTDNKDLGETILNAPEYRESFIATRMEYMGRIWQLDWNIEHALMRLSIVKSLDHGSNAEVVSIVSYIRPGHRHYVEGRSLNDTLRVLVVEFSDGVPPADDGYVSPWEKHFALQKGNNDV